MSNEVGIWIHKSSLADQEPNNAASSVAFLTIILSHKSENKTKPKEKKKQAYNIWDALWGFWIPTQATTTSGPKHKA